MKIIRKVYLSGLGAIGGMYAGIIYNTDPDAIQIIADNNRITRYAKTGVSINGIKYPFRYVQPQQEGEKADLIIISVKNHHLEQSLNDIERFIDSDTIIISLLNGIVSEDITGSKYGHEKVIHSFVVGTDAVREETNITFSNIGKIIFGAKDENGIENTHVIKEFFDRTGIPYKISENIIRELWWKFMMNVGINQISAVLKANYGVFQKISEARSLVEQASSEVVAISQKLGINLGKDDISEYMKIIDTLSPEGKTSMLQDVEAGRKTEVDIFSGTVIELGKKYSVNTPVNDLLYKMIRTMEQMHR
jgi:2-dehydropantoate 2-reductase